MSVRLIRSAWWFGWFWLAAISLHTPSLGADENTVSVKAGVDRATLTIGDPVEYTITVKHRPDVEILSSLPAPDADVLKVKNIEDIRAEEGGSVIEGKKFTLTTYRLGEFVLDSVTVEYKTPAGETGSVSTNPIYLTVKSVDEGKEKVDIRGVKTVRSIKRTKLMSSLLGVLSVIVIGILGWMAYAARRKKTMGAEPEPEMTPEEEALAHLTGLFDSDWLRRGRTREYFFRMTDILKRYFERRITIPAAEATTYEILRMLRDKNISGSPLEHVRDLMESADFVKFAKWVPNPAQIIAMNQKATQIVEDFRPQNRETGRDVQ